jgi:hypothetical protein
MLTAWLDCIIGRGRSRKQHPVSLADYGPEELSQEADASELPPPPPAPGSSDGSGRNLDSRLQAEIALQEREADLSMEDLVQQHYEEPNEQELDDEVCL